jgi:GNAT superfamily N-acetyltransferase
MQPESAATDRRQKSLFARTGASLFLAPNQKLHCYFDPKDVAEMNERKLEIVTAVDVPDLLNRVDEFIIPSWPEFMLHDHICDRYWGELYKQFPAYQFALREPNSEKLIAAGNSIPLLWEGELGELPDEGWDWALAKGCEDHKAGLKPTILCALQIVVRSEFRRQGISYRAINTMKQIGADSGLNCLVAPVRPDEKAELPQMTIDEYIDLIDSSNLPQDNWLRAHVRIGGEIIRACPRAMHITGSVAEWEKWTGLKFDSTGDHIVPGALVPVRIDIEADRGTYIEPNVWMLHRFK